MTLREVLVRLLAEHEEKVLSPERNLSRRSEALLCAPRQGAEVGVQDTDCVLPQGRGGGLPTETWYDKVMRTLKAAYPALRS